MTFEFLFFYFLSSALVGAFYVVNMSIFQVNWMNTLLKGDSIRHTSIQPVRFGWKANSEFISIMKCVHDVFLHISLSLFLLLSFRFL